MALEAKTSSESRDTTPSGRPRRKRRPNASGFAKTDCHTCENEGISCDRLLPRCEACLDKGRICGGYVVALKWDPSMSIGIQSNQSVLGLESTKPILAPDLQESKSREIKFKVGKPRQKRIKKSDENNHGSEKGAMKRATKGKSPDSSAYGTPEPFEEGSNSTSASFVPTGSIPPAMEISSLADNMNEVLELYDREFCVAPLTSDVALNPFRCRNISLSATPSLLHAVLALSSLHMHRMHDDDQFCIQTSDHAHTALRLLREALPNAKSKAFALLDTMLILFSVGTARSALEPWRLHLAGSYNILESAGGLHILPKLPPLRPKVACFLWWDVCVALIARKIMIFPYEYLQPTLVDSDRDGWTFFDLHGIPCTLFEAMVQLSTLFGISDSETRQRTLREIIHKVEAWENREELGIPETQNKILESDRYHLAQAWRFGILLYVSRIFATENNTSTAARSVSLAEIIIHHIRSVHRETTITKQVFLPLFLAGSEVYDVDSREFCRDYCRFFSGNGGYKEFNNVSGYGMFADAASLLEQIWLERDLVEGDHTWWGEVVDRNIGDPGGLESHFLFG